jgi:hypothetical protein
VALTIDRKLQPFEKPLSVEEGVFSKDGEAGKVEHIEEPYRYGN